MSHVTCTDGYIGESVTIRMARPVSGSYFYTLEYAFGDTNGTIATKVPSYSSPFKWTLPDDFYYQLPNSTSGTAQILYSIYDDAGVEVASGYTDFTIMVPNNTTSRPTFTVSFTEEDPKVAAITRVGIKYVSDIGYTINATGYKGASIVGYRVQNGQDVLTTKSGTFHNVTSASYQVIVTDSRGITNSTIYTYALNDYIRLTCNMWLEEVDPQDGTITLGLDGNYHNSNFYATNSDNTLTIRVDLVDKDNVTLSKTVTTQLNGNTYTGTVVFEDIDYRAVYEATAFANDKLTSVQSKTVLCVGTPVFDWSDEDFRFNVPVTKVGEYEWADFVIEVGEERMGTNGTWYWRKWKSGRAECYGSRNFGITAHRENIIEGVYGWKRTSSVFNQPLPSGLFIDMPEVIDIRLKYGGKPGETASTYGGMVYLIGEGADDNWMGHEIIVPSKDNTGSFVFIHPIDTSSYPMPASHVGFNIIGRWK